jgi:hypothetical protein
VPQVFKKQIVRHLDPKGRQVPKDTPGARKVKEESTKWYGRVPGEPRPVPLSANKAAAERLLHERIRRAERVQVHGPDPYEAHRNRPLAEHLDDYTAALLAGGATPKHVRQTAACARRVLTGCRFVLMADLSASAVQQYLAGLRDVRHALPPLDPARQSYTKRELAAALGVKPPAVPPLVQRHRLPAAGNGKARRYPRGTAQALWDLRTRGRSIKTSNLYLEAAKSFCAWLMADRRMPDNPLAHLAGGNVKLDRRRLPQPPPQLHRPAGPERGHPQGGHAARPAQRPEADDGRLRPGPDPRPGAGRAAFSGFRGNITTRGRAGDRDGFQLPASCSGG